MLMLTIIRTEYTFPIVNTIVLSFNTTMCYNSRVERTGKEVEKMLNLIEKLASLQNNDGLTLKSFQEVTFKTGWQVADFGKEVYTAEAAYEAICEMGGNAGVWFSEGVYYIDHSFRIKTKKEAVAIGKQHNQQSILRWADMSLVWLNVA